MTLADELRPIVEDVEDLRLTCEGATNALFLMAQAVDHGRTDINPIAMMETALGHIDGMQYLFRDIAGRHRLTLLRLDDELCAGWHRETP